MPDKFKSFLDTKYFDESIKAERIDKITASKDSISKYRSSVGAMLEPFKLRYKSLFLVALDEVITNIAEHGLKFDKRKRITASIYIKLPFIALVLHDKGIPYDPSKNRAKSPRKQFDKGADGGYGMFILKRVFFKIDYHPDPGTGNTLSLLFSDEKVKIP